MRQGRKLWVLLVALIVAALAAPAFAEVQNVKVGGDITVRGIWRANFDLRDDSNFITTGTSDAQKFIFSTVGINLTADLTDNVSADIRLSNQRDWGGNANTGLGNSSLNVDVSRAYVTMKEMLYSPLTIRLGRQPLWFGKGFIVGSRLLAGDFDPNTSFSADEFTDQTGFDAIRATLDFNPATIDVVYAKVFEGNAASDNDINLTGINAGYKFSSMNGEVEGYYWNVHNSAVSSALGPAGLKPTIVNTVGFRGSVEPVANSSFWGESAIQWGDIGGLASTTQRAWAFDFGGDYTLADVAWTPKLGVEWIFYSGGSKDSAGNGWNPIFRGKFETLIREFQAAGLYPTDTPSDTNSTTNEHQLAFFGAVKPTDSIKLDSRVTVFAADTGIRIGNNIGARSKTPHYIGSEWDTKATYDYTEDVQIGLIYGVFWPGDVFRHVSGTDAPLSPGGKPIAQELVSTVSVKF